MKKALVIGISLMMCMFFVSPAVFADTEGDATATATVEIVPNITVGPTPNGADMGQIQTGEFSGTFGFQVDSNVQYVDIQISATNLYKGGESTSEEQIPVADTVPVEVDPTCAVPQLLAYDGTTVVINDLDGKVTAFGTFESGQDSHFSCGVDAVVTWDQIDPEQPEGDYMGFVKIYAMITP